MLIIIWFDQVVKYVVNTKPYYYYFHRGDSITTKPYAKRRISLYMMSIKNSIMSYENYPDLKEMLFLQIGLCHFFILDKMLLDDQYKQFEAYSQIHRF